MYRQTTVLWDTSCSADGGVGVSPGISIALIAGLALVIGDLALLPCVPDLEPAAQVKLKTLEASKWHGHNSTMAAEHISVGCLLQNLTVFSHGFAAPQRAQ
mgnify:CR=1 FL=1